MNKIPSILVDTGFPVDQNGALTELDIPNVVETLDPPKKVVFNGTVLNWVPSTAAALQELVATNMTSLVDTVSGAGARGGTFKDYSSLVSVTFNKLETLGYIAAGTSASWATGGAFNGCTSLTTVIMPALTTLYTTTNNATAGVFGGATSLVNISLPSLQRINDTKTNGGNCGSFLSCTNLQNVTLGSAGKPVLQISSLAFTGCTQPGLTITIYTNGGAALAGEPWGATNSDTDIIYEVA